MSLNTAWTRSSQQVTLQRVWFDAPLRTGWRIDLQTILADQYRDWDDMWSPGNHLASSLWVPSAIRRRSNNLVFDIDDYTGAGRPPWLAECPVPATLIDELNLIWPDFTISSAVLRLYTFGIAQLHAELTPSEYPITSYCDPLQRIESVSSEFATPLGDWISHRLAEIEGALPEAILNYDGSEASEMLGMPPAGSPLWFHRIVVASSVGGRTQLDETPDHSVFVQGEHLTLWEDGQACAEVWVGHGTSVVELMSREAGGARSVISAISLSNAYYAGAMELASLVIQRQADIAAIRRARDSDALRAESLKLIEQHDELTLFRTMIRDQFAKRSMGERAVVDVTCASWRFDELLRDLDQHRVDLAEIHEQALSRLAADDSSRLNLVVFGLTLISTVQVITELLGFVQEEGFGSPNGIRLLVVTAMMFVLLAIAYTTLRFDRIRPRGRRRSV